MTRGAVKSEVTTLPLSGPQTRLWVHEQVSPNQSSYNIPVRIDLAGVLDIPVLRASLQAIVQRHEILRFRFNQIDGTPSQTVSSARLELQHSIPGDLEAAILEEAQKPFDLSTHLLIRAVLFSRSRHTHTLVVTMHHIISEEHTFTLFFEELTIEYNRRVADETTTVPEPVRQYRDFVTQQRSSHLGAAPDQDFWKNYLTPLPPASRLYYSSTELTQPGVCGKVACTILPETLSNALVLFCRNHNCTLFNLFFSAFSILLHRHARSTDFIIGTPFSFRMMPEWMNVMGYFVNPLPVRVQIDDSISFGQFIVEVRQNILELLTKMDSPIEQMIESARSAGTGNQSPLFQHMVVVGDPANPDPWNKALQLSGLSTSATIVRNNTAKADLTLEVHPHPAAYEVSLEYRADLFSPAFINSLLDQLKTILRQVITQASIPLRQIALSSEQERAFIASINPIYSPTPKDQSVHGLLSKLADKYPDKIALQQGKDHLTYAQLDERSLALACFLRDEGVQPGNPVILFTERSMMMIIAMLGILKAGAVYVPLEIADPEKRTAALLAETDPAYLITTTKQARHLPQNRIPSLQIDTFSFKAGIGGPLPEVNATSPSYIMFTSGSTGVPKGVIVPHQAIIRVVCGGDFGSFGTSTVMLHMASTSFDASTLEVWAPLLNGGTCVIHTQAIPSISSMAREIERHRVNTLWLTAGFLNTIVDEVLPVLKPVQHLITGGDVASASHFGKVLATFPEIELVNGYGPTETTVFATTYTQTPVTSDLVTSIPIGRPISRTQAWILDDKLQPAPLGVPGELCIAGDGLAIGYLHDDELTKERFVTTVLFEADPVRIYRTGDTARLLPDGNIEFLGRLDHQIKIRGFRVECGEIEALLNQHPAIDQAIVQPQHMDSEEWVLIAYFTPTGKIPSTADLRNYLEEQLPSYMIPSVYIALEELPLSSAGKVDRNALPVPSCPPATDLKQIEVRTDQEERILELWQTVLGKPVTSIHHSFFELGGHSLLLIKLHDRLERQYGVTLPLTDLFKFPTIHSFCTFLLDGEKPTAPDRGQRLRSGRARLRRRTLQTEGTSS